jgi:hypothetical protein
MCKDVNTNDISNNLNGILRYDLTGNNGSTWLDLSYSNIGPVSMSAFKIRVALKMILKKKKPKRYWEIFMQRIINIDYLHVSMKEVLYMKYQELILFIILL